MKICHVITRLIIGGAQENTVLSCRGLAERGHDVTLIAGPETGPEGSLWDQAYACGCRVIRLDALRRSVHPLFDIRARGELRRIFAQQQPDVVHTHSSKAGILGRSAAAAEKVPVIIHTIHGMSFNRTQHPAVRFLYRRLERSMARATTRFVAVADAMIEQSVSARIAPRDRFVTIRSGMETDRFKPRAASRQHYRRQWKIADHEIVVGTVARLFENKGYEDIIAAMPAALYRAPNLRFVWIGDGPSRDRYVERLRRLGLRDKVILLGLVQPEELPEHLCGFDVVLHASRWEGLARALVQGLLTEAPAVAFDADGSPEVVLPGLTGFLAPLGDTQSLADAVTTLARDADLRRVLGRAGRERCLSMFDWRCMTEALEKLYADLLQTRAS